MFKDLVTNQFHLNIYINENTEDQDHFSCQLAPKLVNFGLGGEITKDQAKGLLEFLKDHLEEPEIKGCKLK